MSNPANPPAAAVRPYDPTPFYAPQPMELGRIALEVGYVPAAVPTPFSAPQDGVPHPLRAHLIEAHRQADALARAQAAPRHWMLLLADFADEAAVHFRLAEEAGAATGYAQLAGWMRFAAQALPADRPDGTP